MTTSIIVRFETLCGCRREELFEYKDHIPNFILIPIFDRIYLADFINDPTIKYKSFSVRQRKFEFFEILRYEYNLIFVYREVLNG
jgi:hypothetical protein